MSKSHRVIIPFHITGFWYSVSSDDPLYTGSLGAGVNLKPGITVRPNDKFEILDENGSKFLYETYKDSFEISGFKKIGLILEGDNLLGLGFGLSAGYALAGLMLSALREGKGVTWGEVGRYVHVSEVRNRTGYGDVIALITGGLEVRLAPGAPGTGYAEKVPSPKDIKVLVSILGGLTTPEMLKIFGDKISKVGPKIHSFFRRAPSFERFIEASYRFSREVGMLSSELETKLKSIVGRYLRKGSILGYHRKKNLLVFYVEDDVEEIYQEVSKYWRSYIYTIDFCGVRVE